MEIINDSIRVDARDKVRNNIWDNGNLLDSTDKSIMVSVQNHVWNSISRRTFGRVSGICRKGDLLKILKYKDSAEILRISQPRGDFRAEYGSERGFEMMSARNPSKRERRAPLGGFRALRSGEGGKY